MKKAEMICRTCIYVKQLDNGKFHCTYGLPARWESVLDYADFPEVAPEISCGQGVWVGLAVLQEGTDPIMWQHNYGDWDEDEEDAE